MAFKNLGKLYKTLLAKHPFLVQSVQAGALMGTGDLIAQTIIEKKSFKQIEPKRTLKFVFLGTCFVGPCSVTWYKFLSKTLGDTGKTVVLKKVALDQLVYSPIFTAVFLVAINILNGRGFEDIKREMRSMYVQIMINNYKLWPPAQLVNFYLMPLNYQVLFVNLVALIWNSYLSWKIQGSSKS